MFKDGALTPTLPPPLPPENTDFPTGLKTNR